LPLRTPPAEAQVEPSAAVEPSMAPPPIQRTVAPSDEELPLRQPAAPPSVPETAAVGEAAELSRAEPSVQRQAAPAAEPEPRTVTAGTPIEPPVASAPPTASLEGLPADLPLRVPAPPVTPVKTPTPDTPAPLVSGPTMGQRLQARTEQRERLPVARPISLVQRQQDQRTTAPEPTTAADEVVEASLAQRLRARSAAAEEQSGAPADAPLAFRPGTVIQRVDNVIPDAPALDDEQQAMPRGNRPAPPRPPQRQTPTPPRRTPKPLPPLPLPPPFVPQGYGNSLTTTDDVPDAPPMTTSQTLPLAPPPTTPPAPRGGPRPLRVRTQAPKFLKDNEPPPEPPKTPPPPVTRKRSGGGPPPPPDPEMQAQWRAEAAEREAAEEKKKQLALKQEAELDALREAMAGGSRGSDVDIQDLARRVYPLIRRLLLLDKERR
jgi:hypothetical protein